MRQLLDLATLIVADPFERTRPLWQFVVVDGLRGGKSALIQKMHHTVTDGERGVQLSLQYLDFERDAPDPPPLSPPEDRDDEPVESSGADGVRTFVAGSLRLPLGVARQVRDLLADPAGLPSAGNAAANTVRGIVSQLADTDKARSPLWTARSLRRHIEVTRAPFRETKDAAARLGGTLNTAFMTAAADAASKYHIKMGSPTEALRASMAVSTRTESSGANAFSVIRMLVPTAEMPIAERFAAIHEATAVAKEHSKSAGLDTLAAVASTLPTSVVTRLARQQTQTVDFATSNVRGAPIEMYIAGAQMLENYPDRTARGRRVQPHDDVVPRQPRHGDQHRRRRGRGPGAVEALSRAITRRAVGRLTRRRAASAPQTGSTGLAVSSVRTSRRTSATSPDDINSRDMIWPSARSITSSASRMTASLAASESPTP